MSFDFFQPFVEADERQAELYERELVRLFEQSAEGEAVRAQGFGSTWVGYLVHYGLSHLGVSPATMNAVEMDEIVFQLLPNKVSCDSSVAPAVVAELRAFFRFAEREFGFTRAAECLAVLDESCEERLAQEFEDPANWGMAKSMVMAGKQAGFDMTTEAGLMEFMAAYNAALPGTRPGFSLPSFAPEPAGPLGGGLSREEREARRRKRKMQKAARKRGR